MTPGRFAARWLTFDERRPTRPRLARRFLAALLAMLLLSALLAIVTAL
jgi:cell division protein FtsB